MINNREVTKKEWQEAYKKHENAKVILRIDTLPSFYRPISDEPVVSPEKAKEIRKTHKKVLTLN